MREKKMSVARNAALVMVMFLSAISGCSLLGGGNTSSSQSSPPPAAKDCGGLPETKTAGGFTAYLMPDCNYSGWVLTNPDYVDDPPKSAPADGATPPDQQTSDRR